MPFTVFQELKWGDRSSLLGLGRHIAQESRVSKEYPGAWVREQLAQDAAALKAKIDALPPLHVSEQDADVPVEAVSASQKESILESRAATINAQSEPAAGIGALVSDPEFPLIAEQIGSASTATLKQRSEELLVAQGINGRIAEELAGIRQSIKEEKAAADERAAKEAKRRAELERRQPVSALYGSDLRVVHGRRYRIPRSKAIQLMYHVIDQVHDGVHYIDEVSFFAAIDGADGSTTGQALSKLRATAIGRYYVLPGDAFQIQADRDYPLSGRTTFTMFGRRRLVEDHWVPLNVECISTEPVPPYSMAPVLVRFIGFRPGESRSGQPIIVAIAKVIDVFAIPPSSEDDVPAEVIINQDNLP
jgi:hypothetical protein